MRLLRFLRYIFDRFPRLILINAAMLAVANLLDAATVLAIAPIVDFLTKPSLQESSRLTQKIVGLLSRFGFPADLKGLLLFFIGLFALMNAFQIVARYFTLRTKYAMLRDLYLGTFDDFFRARWYFFTSHAQGALLNTFMREVTVVGEAFGSLAQFLASLIQLVLYVAVPFYLSWQITLICLATTGVLALPFVLVGKWSYRLGQLNTSTANKAIGLIQENLSLAKIVLGFGNQEKNSKTLAKAFDAHLDVTVKSQVLSGSISNLYHPLGMTVLGVALLAARRFSVPLSETAVLLVALVKIIPAIGQLATQKNGLDSFFPSFEQVLGLRARAKELEQKTGEKKFTGFSKEIVVENATFAYPGHEPSLSEVTVRVPKGKMVAFVGESGAGKSTLVDLIMGFHELSAGKILVDGAPLEGFDVNSYRRRIGYVPQDSVLFNGSIRDNLLWAKGDATEDELRQALREANALDFIEEARDGLDTQIGDRGVRLSGGQIQRIALARAVLRRPELLILDEATSALDSQSERLIQSAIDRISKETTIVVIAHRLSTIVKADRIYVLKKGRVVEEGTYESLNAADGLFQRMTQMQILKAA